MAKRGAVEASGVAESGPAREISTVAMDIETVENNGVIDNYVGGTINNSGSITGTGTINGDEPVDSITCDFTVSGGMEGRDYIFQDGALYILTDKDIKIKNTDPTKPSKQCVVVKSNNANITLEGVNIDMGETGGAALEIQGTGNVTVKLEGYNTLKSGENCAGLQKNSDDCHLTINGTGSLTAEGGDNAAGIGGANSSSLVLDRNSGKGTVKGDITLKDDLNIGMIELEIEEDATLTILNGAAFTSDGNIIVKGKLVNGGILANGGTLNVDGQLVNNSTPLSNGILNVNANGQFVNRGAFTNTGPTNIYGHGRFVNDGTFTNDGTTYVHQDGWLINNSKIIYLGIVDNTYGSVEDKGEISDNDPESSDDDIGEWRGNASERDMAPDPEKPDKPEEPEGQAENPGGGSLGSIPNVPSGTDDESGKGVPPSVKKLWIQFSSDSRDGMYIEIESMNTEVLGIRGSNLTTVDGANKAISRISDAIKKVSTIRGTVGAQQNRLEHTISQQRNTAENITDAESQIRDTDIAEEIMGMIKSTILSQAGMPRHTPGNSTARGVRQ